MKHPEERRRFWSGVITRFEPFPRKRRGRSPSHCRRGEIDAPLNRSDGSISHLAAAGGATQGGLPPPRLSDPIGSLHGTHMAPCEPGRHDGPMRRRYTEKERSDLIETAAEVNPAKRGGGPRPGDEVFREIEPASARLEGTSSKIARAGAVDAIAAIAIAVRLAGQRRAAAAEGIGGIGTAGVLVAGRAVVAGNVLASLRVGASATNATPSAKRTRIAVRARNEPTASVRLATSHRATAVGALRAGRRRFRRVLTVAILALRAPHHDAHTGAVGSAVL
jgi:hypothetical protein